MKYILVFLSLLSTTSFLFASEDPMEESTVLTSNATYGFHILGPNATTPTPFTVFIMVPPENLLDAHNTRLLKETTASVRGYGYNLKFVQNSDPTKPLYGNLNRELGSFITAFEYMEANNPSHIMVVLQHSMQLVKPLKPLTCDVETIDILINQDWGMTEEFPGMIFVSRLLREGLNVSCGNPCSGPIMKTHFHLWKCLPHSSLILTPQARRILAPFIEYLKKEIPPGTVQKPEAEGVERMWGVLAQYVCLQTTGTKCSKTCFQNVGLKTHGYLN